MFLVSTPIQMHVGTHARIGNHTARLDVCYTVDEVGVE